MTPEITQNAEFLKQFPVLIGVGIVVFLLNTIRSIFVDIYDRYKAKPTTQQGGGVCLNHDNFESKFALMLDSKFAIILEKINAIHDWQQKNDIAVTKDIDDLQKRMRGSEARIKVLESMSVAHIVVNDDTKGVA